MVDSEFIEVCWTSGSLDEARRISRYLVQERYVASAQIVPWVESIFMWNNQLDTTQESKIIFQTRFENYGKIKEIIEQNSKYEVPQIIFMKIAGGNKTYMDWLQESILVEEKISHS